MLCNDCHVTYLNLLELICAMVQNMVQKVSNDSDKNIFNLSLYYGFL